MNTPHRYPALLATLLAAMLTAKAHAQAVTQAFTYQGELRSNGVPANGSFDLRFSLFTTASSTTQIGTTQCADDVTVVDGFFTVVLDFGSVYQGDQRFLELQVRDAALGACNSTGGFVILAPRQQLTATPYASNASLLGGNAPSFYSNAANLTGTLADARLSTNVARLNAPAVFTSALSASSLTGNAAGATNLNAANVATGTLSDSRLSSNVALRSAVNVFTGADNLFTGSVGVGLGTTPLASLHVRGDSTLGTILLTPNVADANTQFIFSENTSSSNAFIVRYNGAVGNNLELIGRPANNEGTPAVSIGRDNGVVTVGNATDPGRVNIQGGAVALSVASTGTGDGTVLLPASSVSAAEMSNEAGFQTSNSTSVVTMDVNASVTLRSVTINAPSDGFVVVTGSVQVNNNNAVSSTDAAVVLSTSATANAETSGYQTTVIAGRSTTITVHETFAVSAGANTFNMRGWTNGVFVEATRRRITAVFVPTQYP